MPAWNRLACVGERVAAIRVTEGGKVRRPEALWTHCRGVVGGAGGGGGMCMCVFYPEGRGFGAGAIKGFRCEASKGPL